MATREVSTWAELEAAVRAAARGDTIKLIADIDCNDEIPEGVTSTIKLPNTSFANAAITITGEYTENNVTKRHVIKNLRTSISSPVPIFEFQGYGDTSTLNIKGIDFLNLVLGAVLVQTDLVSYNSHILNIRNCRFTGKRTTYLVYLNNNGTLNIFNSYFNIPYYGTTVGGNKLCYITITGNGYMSNCRIREAFTGTYTPSTTDGDTTCSVSPMRLSGCRVEGEVVSGKYARYHPDATMNGYTPAAQNVYDVDFKLINDADTSVPLYAFKGVVKIPIRKKDAETTTYEISSASTGVIQATESQMQDTNWLIQQGFDIVPSDT